ARNAIFHFPLLSRFQILKYSPFFLEKPLFCQLIGPVVKPHSLLFAILANTGRQLTTSGILGLVEKYSDAGSGDGLKKIVFLSIEFVRPSNGPLLRLSSD